MQGVVERAVWLVLTSAWLVGCMSGGLLQEPRPLPPGHVRGGMGLEFGTGGVTPALGMRVGVAPRLELRAKYMAPTSLDVGVNVQAVDSDRIDLMVMPSLTTGEAGSDIDYHDGYKALALPVIVGISLDSADQYQIFVGPDARIGKRVPGYFEGMDVFWASVGWHLGVAVSGPRDYATFVPECAHLITVTGGKPDAWKLERGSSIVQCSLGVTFGARHTRAE